MDEIGLFPLDLVLLPGERAPLHIFEERYKELIGECLTTDDEFGIVLSQGDAVSEVGTTAAVVEVLNQYPDGRLDVVVQGGSVFHVEQPTEGRTFATAIVRVLEDEQIDADPVLVDDCVGAFRELAEAADVEAPEVEPAAGDVSYHIASQVSLPSEVKQSLIESRSENDRLRELADVLRQTAALVARRREIEDRARTNGKVEPL